MTHDRFTQHDDVASEADTLISAIIDDDAGDAQWHRFKQLAEHDASLWQHLALAQRDARVLADALRSRIDAAADTVRIDHTVVHAPTDRSGASPMRHHHPVHTRRPLAAASGWAIAAACALLLVITNTQLFNTPVTPSTQATAGLGAVHTVSTADEAVRAYLELGQRDSVVVGEMQDRYVLGSRPLEDGSGYEVLYVRPFVERAHIADLDQIDATGPGWPPAQTAEPARTNHVGWY